MAGFGECARGSDRATMIQKYDGLPGKGKPIIEKFQRPTEIPVMGTFVSTLDAEQNLNPVLLTSGFGDAIKKPKFTAKITLFDAHSDDNF